MIWNSVTFFLASLLFLSGVFHQSLYLIYPFFAFYLSQKHATIIPKPDQTGKLFAWMLLFVIASIVAHTSINLKINFFELKGLLRYFSYFAIALIANYFSCKSLYKFLYFSSVLIIVLTPIAMIQVVLLDRAELFFGQGNHMAYVVLLLLFFVYKFLDGGWRNFLLVGLFLNLLLTKSTGALLVALLIISYIGISKKPIYGIYAILSLCAMFFIVVQLNAPLFDRLIYQFQFLMLVDLDLIIEKATAAKFGSMGSGIWRLSYWLAIIFEFLSLSTADILFGLGADSMTTGYFQLEVMYIDPHNDFLKVFVEFGVIGVVGLFIFLWRLHVVSGKKLELLIIMCLPMFLGNILVNFPFMQLLVIILTFIEKNRAE